MKSSLIKILASLGVAALLNGLTYILKSSFLTDFIKEDLVGLLLTLLAINTATSTVISSKIDDISRQHGKDLSNVIIEIKYSLKEQIVMIILAIILLIALDSSVLAGCFPDIDKAILLLLTTILIYAMEILRDTGVAIFTIILEMHKKDRGNTS